MMEFWERVWMEVQIREGKIGKSRRREACGL